MPHRCGRTETMFSAIQHDRGVRVFRLDLQFLGGPDDMAAASVHLHHGYSVSGDPGLLIADAIALPVIIPSREELLQDRARVEASLSRLLSMNLR